MQNYESGPWNAIVTDVVSRACRFKFEQNAELRDYLVSTGDATLAQVVWAGHSRPLAAFGGADPVRARFTLEPASRLYAFWTAEAPPTAAIRKLTKEYMTNAS